MLFLPNLWCHVTKHEQRTDFLSQGNRRLDSEAANRSQTPTWPQCAFAFSELSEFAWQCMFIQKSCHRLISNVSMFNMSERTSGKQFRVAVSAFGSSNIAIFLIGSPRHNPPAARVGSRSLPSSHLYLATLNLNLLLQARFSEFKLTNELDTDSRGQSAYLHLTRVFTS